MYDFHRYLTRYQPEAYSRRSPGSETGTHTTVIYLGLRRQSTFKDTRRIVYWGHPNRHVCLVLGVT